jgi:4-amino-4-deoxy-L-arabinose transferase-like glycosyltransferase
VAKRKRRKRSALKTILLFVLTPLIVWALAFVVWLYWNEIANSLAPAEGQPKPTAKTLRKLDKDESHRRSNETRAKEKILDADRKKLDEIIRKENR